MTNSENKKEFCFKLLNLIRAGKYPCPEGSRAEDSDHLILFCILTNSIISKKELHYIGSNHELVSVSQGILY